MASTARSTQAKRGDQRPDEGVRMPLEEAMRTQRSIRRLLKDPVDDEVLLRCIDLALRAPTGSNAQQWEWLIVRDPDAKRRLKTLNRMSWSVYGGLGRLMSRDHPKRLRIIDAVQWQADHFDEAPVIVVPCLRSWVPKVLPVMASSHYGSIYPAIQNFLLACRAEGLGAGLTTLPLWSKTLAQLALGLPFHVQPCAVIPVGWPRGRYGTTTRKPVHRVTHLDRWGNHPTDQARPRAG
jgi:nitroreductase